MEFPDGVTTLAIAITVPTGYLTGRIKACLLVHHKINKNDFNIQKLAFSPLIPIQVT